MLSSSSPKLFAGIRVLHRLLMPRHPPVALTSLTKKFDFRGIANPNLGRIRAFATEHPTDRKLPTHRVCQFAVGRCRRQNHRILPPKRVLQLPLQAEVLSYDFIFRHKFYEVLKRRFMSVTTYIL